ncbi:MAG: 4Fe-4S dicluster domain-containing protein [Desulfosalsimonas sp.]
MEQMGIYFDQTRCTGCYTCVIACKDLHDTPAGTAGLMRVTCFEQGRFPDLFAAYLAFACGHCENPPCMAVCPENAISKRKSDGIVTVDADKCAGNSECPEKCLKACPWDAPCFGTKQDAKMQKCDLCAGRLDQGKKPVCEEACPMYAIEIAPLKELRQKYSDCTEAEGFKYLKRFGPAVVFTPKKRKNK